jgi:hypothetical protein
MSLAKTLLTTFLTTFVALSLAATASAQIRPAAITGAVTDQSGAAAANAEVVTTNSGTNVSYKTKTTAAGLYRMPCPEAGTYTLEVINDVPNVTQNPLFYAMLQNGLQPRNETSTSTLGDL